MRSHLLVFIILLAAHRASAREFSSSGLHSIDARTSAGDIVFSAREGAKVSVELVKVSTIACDISMSVKRDVLVLRAQSKVFLVGKPKLCLAGLRIKAPAALSLDARSGSGAIDIFASEGRLGLHAGSGDIRIDGAGGEVTARAGSGSLDAKGLTSGALVRGGSGDIRLRWAKAPEKAAVDIRSGSGSVTLEFPPRAKLRTSLRAGSGAAANEFSETEDAALSVTVRTGSGAISVRKSAGRKTQP